MLRTLRRIAGPGFALLACGGAAADTAPPNVLLISIDTLRRDHLGCYGYERETTPNLDELAGRGIVFENAFSTCSWTLPAHASILTGLYPAFHGLQDDGNRLSDSVPTLAEGMRGAGYHTVAVVAHVYVSSEFGLERGFDRFDDTLLEGGAVNPTAGQVVDRAVEILAELPERTFFAFLHFFDPHWDYTPPEPYARRFTDPDYEGPVNGTVRSLVPYFQPNRTMPPEDLRQAVALYDGEIAYVDAEIGRLLDWMRGRGLLENTVVVVTADHGEEFREHGMLGHGRTLYGEQTRIPLLAVGRPFPAGRRSERLASLVDVAPTLLELAGVESGGGLQGVSLRQVSPPPDRSVLSESIRFGNEMRAVEDVAYKLLHVLQGDRHLFFDLAEDPGERSPRPRDPTGGRLTRRLAEYASEADRGWHLKLIALRANAMRCRGTLAVQGRIVEPRRFYSANLSPPSQVRFDVFERSAGGDTLRFDATLSAHVAEITFETHPPDAPVTVDVRIVGGGTSTGLFLGSGWRVEGPLHLDRTDARLRGVPDEYRTAVSGCYVRATEPRTVSAEPSSLSEEAVQRLRALGYVD